jgi:hypothetical protein
MDTSTNSYKMKNRKTADDGAASVQAGPRSFRKPRDSKDATSGRRVSRSSSAVQIVDREEEGPIEYVSDWRGQAADPVNRRGQRASAETPRSRSTSPSPTRRTARPQENRSQPDPSRSKSAEAQARKDAWVRQNAIRSKEYDTIRSRLGVRGFNDAICIPDSDDDLVRLKKGQINRFAAGTNGVEANVPKTLKSFYVSTGQQNLEKRDSTSRESNLRSPSPGNRRRTGAPRCDDASRSEERSRSRSRSRSGADRPSLQRDGIVQRTFYESVGFRSHYAHSPMDQRQLLRKDANQMQYDIEQDLKDFEIKQRSKLQGGPQTAARRRMDTSQLLVPSDQAIKLRGKPYLDAYGHPLRSQVLHSTDDDAAVSSIGLSVDNLLMDSASLRGADDDAKFKYHRQGFGNDEPDISDQNVSGAEWGRLMQWLKEHNILKYASSFARGGVTKLSVVELLHADDLRLLGVEGPDTERILGFINEFSSRTRSFSQRALDEVDFVVGTETSSRGAYPVVAETARLRPELSLAQDCLVPVLDALLSAFDAGSASTFKQYWNVCVDRLTIAASDSGASVGDKVNLTTKCKALHALYFNLQLYFAVYPIVHNLSSEKIQAAMRLLRSELDAILECASGPQAPHSLYGTNFKGSIASVKSLTCTKEFAQYAGIVFTPDPQHNALYAPLFQPIWSRSLRQKLQLFLKLIGITQDDVVITSALSSVHLLDTEVAESDICEVSSLTKTSDVAEGGAVSTLFNATACHATREAGEGPEQSTLSNILEDNDASTPTELSTASIRQDSRRMSSPNLKLSMQEIMRKPTNVGSTRRSVCYSITPSAETALESNETAVEVDAAEEPPSTEVVSMTTDDIRSESIDGEPLAVNRIGEQCHNDTLANLTDVLDESSHIIEECVTSEGNNTSATDFEETGDVAVDISTSERDRTSMGAFDGTVDGSVGDAGESVLLDGEETAFNNGDGGSTEAVYSHPSTSVDSAGLTRPIDTESLVPATEAEVLPAPVVTDEVMTTRPPPALPSLTIFASVTPSTAQRDDGMGQDADDMGSVSESPRNADVKVAVFETFDVDHTDSIQGGSQPAQVNDIDKELTKESVVENTDVDDAVLSSTNLIPAEVVVGSSTGLGKALDLKPKSPSGASGSLKSKALANKTKSAAGIKTAASKSVPVSPSKSDPATPKKGANNSLASGTATTTTSAGAVSVEEPAAVDVMAAADSEVQPSENPVIPVTPNNSKVTATAKPAPSTSSSILAKKASEKKKLAATAGKPAAVAASSPSTASGSVPASPSSRTLAVNELSTRKSPLAKTAAAPAVAGSPADTKANAAAAKKAPAVSPVSPLLARVNTPPKSQLQQQVDEYNKRVKRDSLNSEKASSILLEVTDTHGDIAEVDAGGTLTIDVANGSADSEVLSVPNPVAGVATPSDGTVNVNVTSLPEGQQQQAPQWPQPPPPPSIQSTTVTQSPSPPRVLSKALSKTLIGDQEEGVDASVSE